MQCSLRAALVFQKPSTGCCTFKSNKSSRWYSDILEILPWVKNHANKRILDIKKDLSL